MAPVTYVHITMTAREQFNDERFIQDSGLIHARPHGLGKNIQQQECVDEAVLHPLEDRKQRRWDQGQDVAKDSLPMIYFLQPTPEVPRTF